MLDEMRPVMQGAHSLIRLLDSLFACNSHSGLSLDRIWARQQCSHHVNRWSWIGRHGILHPWPDLVREAIGWEELGWLTEGKVRRYCRHSRRCVSGALSSLSLWVWSGRYPCSLLGTGATLVDSTQTSTITHTNVSFLTGRHDAWPCQWIFPSSTSPGDP